MMKIKILATVLLLGVATTLGACGGSADAPAPTTSPTTSPSP
jgi:ABC-type glycerol-3-phosphate transport system substrate-binding protein